MGLLIVTGISGAGKTTVSDTLEDIGYNCIDNLPASLLPAVSKLKNKDLAVVVDTKGEEQLDEFFKALTTLDENKVEYQLLFLDCDEDVILRRYKYNRRPHPMLNESCPTIEQAIEKEIELCRPLTQKADKVIDTTYLNAKQLKQTIVDEYKNRDYKAMTIKIISFGFKNGLPAEADLVYDVRCTPNPFYLPELRELSGLDQEVADYVFSFEQSEKMLKLIYDFIDYSLPYYIAEGKTELTVGIGCTSGHHRSVSFACKLAGLFEGSSYGVVCLHRDINKDF